MKGEVYIEDLARLGLTNYEVKIYLALLEKKHLSATEIARLANVPRTCVYDDLKLLEQKGLCKSISGKTKLYSAAEPSLIKDILYKSEQDKVNSRVKEYQEKIKVEKDRLVEKFNSVENLVEKLTPIYKNSRGEGNPFDYLEIVMTPTQVFRKFYQLFSETTSEVVSFSKPPFSITTKEQDKKMRACGEEAIKRGVKLKYVFEIPSDKKEKAIFIDDILANYEPDIEELKVIDSLPIKLAIFDARVVMFTLIDPIPGNSSIASLVAKNTSLARGLMELFELYWEKAMDPKVLKEMV